jgi:hypothetical protein
MRTTLEGDQAEGIHWAGIDVRPAHPEEGEITGSTTVLVAPSRVWIDADGTISGGRLVIDGSLSWVDLAAIDASAAVGDFEVDPAGKPIAGGSVRATITHLVPVKRQIGTMYDFIEKRVVPQYEYDVDEVLLGTKTLTSASNGSVHLSMAVPNPGDGYRVVLTASDPERRPIQRTIHAAAGQTDPSSARPYLEYRGACGGTPQRVSGLNEPVTLTMHDGDGSVADGRFLFLVAERGAVEATIQDAATFARVLADRDLPGFTVRAIWLSGNGYALSTVNAVVDPADKTITIKLTPDQSRYEPGDPVTVGVTTTDATGKPMAADVVIQGVDEKLYTLGQAFDFDPRAELLALPDAGFLQAYRSHATPRDDDGGCGAEGGSRDDFRDTVVFQRIATDAQGRGSVSFDLSDDLTSWHLSAVAVSDAFDSGSASVVIPVGLPFAVDATLAPEYLVGEQVVLRVRGFGGKLVTGNKIRFSDRVPPLVHANSTVDAAAFESGRVALPALVAGDHEIRIAGETTVDGVVLRDSLVRTIHVIETRLGTLTSNYEALGPGFAPAGGEGFTRYVITDEGRGRLIGTLERLAGARSARFDRNAAAELARQVLIDEYDVPPASLAAIGFDPQLYQPSGISLLPYSTADTFLTARAVLLATSAITGEDLREPLLGWAESGTTSEQRVAAYAGLAALGDDVVASLRALDLPTATVRERIWVALGLAASGDEQGARAIERAVLEANGERLGRWVRLNGDVSIDRTLEVTALLMVLAARLGDPIADDLARYLTDNPSPTTVFPIEELAYVQATLERLPRTSGRFAWTIAGERTEVALERGGAYTLVLTPGQRATFTLQPIEGSLGVATTWTAAGAALPATTGVKVTRTVTPGGSTTEDRLVHVAFTVAFGPSPVSGCYRLSDLVPSGLAPVASSGVLYEEDEPLNLVRPYEVDGQRVSWCVAPRVGSYTYGYSARVVSPGTYRWEPAVLQAERAPTIGGSTEATTYTIR